MKLQRVLPALLLLACRAETHRAAPTSAPPDASLVHASAAPVATKITDLSDPSWYACSSSADCVLEVMTANCDWIAVRRDKSFEHRQLYPPEALGSRPYNDNEFGPICKDPRLDSTKPLPMAVCKNGRCAAGDCPPGKRGPGGWCATQ